jgi:hypothetical protein
MSFVKIPEKLIENAFRPVRPYWIICIDTEDDMGIDSGPLMSQIFR